MVVLLGRVGVRAWVAQVINQLPSAITKRIIGFDSEGEVVDVEVLGGDDLLVSPVLVGGVDVGSDATLASILLVSNMYGCTCM